MMLWAVLLFLPCVLALDNGLALTPPMGWMTWERFRCNTNCSRHDPECISENLIKRIADRMVSDGYRDAGYKYVGIDDCWMEKERGPDGRLVPDRNRFPGGMETIASYLHSRGLKFALYQDYGTKTCAGYPGVLGHEKLDIETFVEWKVDYIKLDGCHIDPMLMDSAYPQFGKLLNETGRPILYSCSWPAYQEDEKIHANYTAIAENCNMWRNYDDIQDSLASLNKIKDWFGDNQDRFAHLAGPGNWNDPDMLLIGNFGLTEDQARMQMALWTIMAAPLIMSVDLDTIKPEFKAILLNQHIIDINQDKLGKQGRRVWKKDDAGERSQLEVWTRELEFGNYAVAFVSNRDDGLPYSTGFTLEEMKLPNHTFVGINLFNRSDTRGAFAGYRFEVRINPSGAEFFMFEPRGKRGSKIMKYNDYKEVRMVNNI